MTSGGVSPDPKGWILDDETDQSGDGSESGATMEQVGWLCSNCGDFSRERTGEHCQGESVDAVYRVRSPR